MIPGCNQIRFTNTLKCRSPAGYGSPSCKQIAGAYCDNLPAASRCCHTSCPRSLISCRSHYYQTCIPKLFHTRDQNSVIFCSPAGCSHRDIHYTYPIIFLILQNPAKSLQNIFFPAISRSVEHLQNYQTTPRGNSSDPSFRSPSVTTNNPTYMGSVRIIIIRSDTMSDEILKRKYSPCKIYMRKNPGIQNTHTHVLSCISGII